MWSAIPYCGVGPVPGELWGRWNLDPYLLSLLALLLGWAALRPAGLPRRAALGGWLVLALAFVSPLCALSSALFSSRVAHHVLLVGAAAPLLALALASPPRGAGAGPWRALQGALGLAVPAHILALWLWHAPPLYAAALSSHALYWAMQASLLGTGLWFWSAALARRDASPPFLAALLTMMAQMGLLGALITFAPAPLYAPHLGTTQAWGLSPLQDQQLGGLIMWVPASLVYLGAALLHAAQGLREPAPDGGKA
ncbi:CAAX protease [Pseudoroseomonas rhizosphaerae]|uniref:CAAX protease n=1 Tax=Teichococcus rhizosphaerae TaxID=1335062 RepID=A0A2C7AAZ3_9PROT|nr:cytochrome c oxidase assembly protein [Pseudoroseomonas rhizosphaerae]PHK94254.1 CAAX protease [Pseudoroseomonas rhizosphaerae]